jgi:membrane protease YdiL (CAAX protease family)
MTRLWVRLPVLIRATVTGGLVAAAGVVPWSAFVLLNQKYAIAVPWAIVPTAIWLWIFWRWLGGAWRPHSISAARRTLRRANPVGPDAFGMAIFAGMIGFAALMPFTLVLSRLVVLNEAKPMTPPAGMPMLTVFVLLVMASVVAGIVEETGFRGYLQGPIERRHGPAIAILYVGLAFGLAHFLHHPGTAVLAMLPYYVLVAAVYGAMAWATNSILPGLVLHAVGDVFVLTRWWISGKGEWQLTEAAPRLIWDTGPDAAFWGALVAFIVLGALAAGLFATVVGSTREATSPAL